MPRTSSARLHIGIGGWNFKPWRGAFYPAGLPQKKELAYAASRLTSIEINSTFYGSQKPASFARWREQAPPGFVFSVKGPMLAMQRGNLAAAGTSINRFFSGGVLELREKLGPVNWQLAPAKKFDAEEIEAFFALLPKKVEGRAIRHAIKVRHESFCDPAFLGLARRHGIAIVLAGDSGYPQIVDDEAPFVYARIMGTTGRCKAGYAPRDLDRWAARIKAWARDGREVFLYVISGFKPRNPAAAMALIERVQ